MNQSLHLIEALKIVLKSKNITYKDVARHLRITEAGVKKALNSETLTLARVEKISMLAGMSLLDLLHLGESEHSQKQVELTDEQERCLASDEQLYVSYYLALAGCSFEDVIRDYKFTDVELERCWKSLESVGLLKMAGVRKIVIRSVLNPLWHEEGPLFKKYGAKLAQEFVVDVPKQGRMYRRFLRGALSDEAFDLFVKKMQQLELEFSLGATRPALANEHQESVAIYHCIRSWKFSVLENYRRSV